VRPSLMQQIGRYEILQEIGRGAMGVVFKGRDPLIGRAVAVKTITAGVTEDADLLERFYREARAAGGLQHPNIVTIYEMAESGGAPFIAMEYLEGESLEKLIARKPALSLGTKVGYVVQTCRALDYAHRRGVIHRDIKPANIMVTRDGIVKVVDFGIARITDTSKTQTGALLGTLAYLSPEQLRGQHADARSDIWALGVVLYELIAYQRPFAGENHAAVLLSILQDEPRSIGQIVPECPAELERVVSRTLRKDDKARYSTMEALLADLENVCALLGREGSRAAAQKEISPAIGQETAVATQHIDLQALSSAQEARPSKSNAPASRSADHRPNTVVPAARAPSANPIAKPGAHPPAKPNAQPTQPRKHSLAQPARHSRRKFLAVYAVLAVALLIALAAVRHRKISTGAANPDITLIPTLPATSSTAKPGTTTKLAEAPTPPLTSASGSSLEDQQRHLIELAHEAADTHDYKTAQIRLDEAAKLNGPLNSLIADLRRQFGEQAYDAELKRAASQEQALWDQGTAALQGGRLDDAERSLREILTLPAGDRQLRPFRKATRRNWPSSKLNLAI